MYIDKKHIAMTSKLQDFDKKIYCSSLKNFCFSIVGKNANNKKQRNIFQTVPVKFFVCFSSQLQ